MTTTKKQKSELEPFFSPPAGDEPEHSNPDTVEFYIAQVGYQVYCEYQMQLLKDLDGESTLI